VNPHGVERKLSAILSADVVPYSRLMDEDEAARLRTVTAYRVEVELLVERCGGQVVDSPRDNLLGEFPSGLEAVRCAMEIREVFHAWNEEVPTDRRMKFRIGIHLGELIVEGERIYGEGVEVASGLERLAEPTGIWISAAVHEQVASRLGLRYEGMGDQWIERISEPVRAYRIRPNPGDATGAERRGFWRTPGKRGS
jgi:adenylate cyclase